MTTRWVSLDKDINKLVNGGNGVQLEIAFFEMMTSDVVVYFNVLVVFLEDIVINNVNSTMIITI